MPRVEAWSKNAPIWLALGNGPLQQPRESESQGGAYDAIVLSCLFCRQLKVCLSNVLFLPIYPTRVPEEDEREHELQPLERKLEWKPGLLLDGPLIGWTAGTAVLPRGAKNLKQRPDSEEGPGREP